MKSILLTSTLILSSIFVSPSAFAHGEVTIHWPSVNGLSVNNACYTGTTFRSLTPVQYCTATTTLSYGLSSHGEMGLVKRLIKKGELLHPGEYLEQDKVCTAYGTKSLEVSSEVTTSECSYYMPAGEAAEPCKSFVSKTTKLGPTFSVEKITDYGQASEETYFNFTVPNCASL